MWIIPLCSAKFPHKTAIFENVFEKSKSIYVGKALRAVPEL